MYKYISKSLCIQEDHSASFSILLFHPYVVIWENLGTALFQPDMPTVQDGQACLFFCFLFSHLANFYLKVQHSYCSRREVPWRGQCGLLAYLRHSVDRSVWYIVSPTKLLELEVQGCAFILRSKNLNTSPRTQWLLKK